MKITAVILAGGRARRMGYVDKALLPIHGKPLIEYVIERIKPQVSHIVINTHQADAAYERFGYPIITDLDDSRQGPLWGIASALRQLKVENMLILPCDVPRFPRHLVRTLEEKFNTRGVDLCMAHDGERIQPLLALMHAGFLQHIENCLARKCFAVERCFTSANYALAYFENAVDDFMNLNEPRHIKLFEQKCNEPDN